MKILIESKSNWFMPLTTVKAIIGQIKLRVTMTQAIIRSATIKDIPQIKILMENVFGPFGKLEELFEKWITQDQFSVKVASLNEQVIGVCTWYIKNDGDFSKYEVFGEKAIDFMKCKTPAWVLNLAIISDHRKNGLGKSLSMAQMSWLKELKCDIVLGTSWVNGSDDNSQHLYLKAGFKKLGESREFLKAQMRNGATCSVCKTSECGCNSILFGIKTDELFSNVKSHHTISNESPSVFI